MLRRAYFVGLAGAVLLFAWVLLGGLQTSSAASLSAMQATATATPASGPGAQVFAAQCARCHGNHGEGAFEGPALGAVLKDAASVPGIEELVHDGMGQMPSFAGKLSTAQIQAVAHFVVDSFGSPGETPTGGVLYRLNCASCHGAQAGGGAIIYNGRQNAPDLLKVSPATIAAAVRGGPGTMPAFNEQALNDTQVASIAKYVQTLQTLPHPGGVETAHLGPVSEGAVAFLALGVIVLGAMWVERGGRG